MGFRCRYFQSNPIQSGVEMMGVMGHGMTASGPIGAFIFHGVSSCIFEHGEMMRMKGITIQKRDEK